MQRRAFMASLTALAAGAGTFGGIGTARAQKVASAPASATIAQRLAAYAAALNYDDLDAGTIEAVKTHTADALGCGIAALGDALTERAHAETGLPKARLEGERGRTVGQLKLFAQEVRQGLWLTPTLDAALPERKPLPRADLRLQKIALGPVAVFGASNFPLAFSVAGGDTAAALAAGCPVIVKAHGAHLGTSEMVGRVIQQAVQEMGLPEGVFSLIVGIVASTIGYNPLFVCLMLFDIIGACVAWRLISSEQKDNAANPALQPSHKVKA